MSNEKRHHKYDNRGGSFKRPEPVKPKTEQQLWDEYLAAPEGSEERLLKLRAWSERCFSTDVITEEDD